MRISGFSNTAGPGAARAVGSLLFCLVLVLLLGAIDFVMRPTPGTAIPWAALAATSDQSDVLVFGSSRAHTSVMPMELWRHSGITAVDVTCGGQPIPATYAYLKQALRTQHPRLVMIEVSQCGRWGNFDDIAIAHSNFDDMPAGMPKTSAILTSQDATRWPEFLFPLHVYHSRWPQLTQYDYRPAKRSTYAYARGAYYLPIVEPQASEVVYNVLKDAEYERDLAYIRKMVRLCSSTGIDVVLFTAPSRARVKVQAVPLLTRLEADLGGESPDVRYLDMNPIAASIGVDSETDWKDYTHLNFGGAVKLSKWLANFLVHEYELADHRDEEFASLWNEDLRRYDEVFLPEW